MSTGSPSDPGFSGGVIAAATVLITNGATAASYRTDDEGAIDGEPRIYLQLYIGYGISGTAYVGKNVCPLYPGEYSLSCLPHSDKTKFWLGEAHAKATRCLTHALLPLLTLLS